MAHWTTIYSQAEYSLEHFFEGPTTLLEYNQNSISLYISGSPQLHLFQVFFINITEEDLQEMTKKIWNTLYVDEWSQDDILVECQSSKVRVRKLYNFPGMNSLDIIRHRIEPPLLYQP